MLEGRKFILFIDHKPLTQVLYKTSDPYNPRQCRQLSYIIEHTSDIRHIAGPDNVSCPHSAGIPGALPSAACVKVPTFWVSACRLMGRQVEPLSTFTGGGHGYF
jgi:hypothetical protein